ncbi:NAD(P)-dependent iron-only hydrogenase iron-sulfur protein [Anaerobranca californiensis DSM 14826]|uniref:NAD(P)-dependent iron-only hydrogenase iron-sulfur protein n=1 Tax=Anaerobranca californiensis DSM 14826 TaxID=1120989 RepID=A0A1M6MPB7_9FIRM|nr:(2Fe-2S) ferredoxin domain-containing protein [Anaerobranca californiensis]SHJ85328.1 NAD(P)-dependent iron-only hydrogenase iron-sulfur protein [Anaerobranca californiensis DSM 14826]
MKSLKELRELKEKALENLKLRNAPEGAKVRIHVGMGTCGIASGARDVFLGILEEINKKNLEGVSLIQVGCLGNCYEEPIVKVIYPDKEPEVYTKVNVEKGKEIVKNLKL